MVSPLFRLTLVNAHVLIADAAGEPQIVFDVAVLIVRTLEEGVRAVLKLLSLLSTIRPPNFAAPLTSSEVREPTDVSEELITVDPSVVPVSRSTPLIEIFLFALISRFSEKTQYLSALVLS